MGFSSKVLVDQDKTETTKSPHGHFSTFTTDKRLCKQDDPPSIEPDHCGHVGDDGAGNDVRDFALDG